MSDLKSVFMKLEMSQFTAKQKLGSRLLLIWLLLSSLCVFNPGFAKSKEGTLIAIVHPEPPTLMLGLNQQGPTLYVAGKIYQSLLVFDAQLNPYPSLARSWEVSKDGLVYTFELQKGVRWHDGKPFSAADVVFSVDVFLRQMHPRARVMINQIIASVTAVNDHRVVFKLKQPFAPFLSSLVVDNMPIVPKHIYEGTDFKNNPANQTPIGTGPFKFKEWKRGSHIILVRNPDYWKKGLPYLDKIIFRVIPDAASRAVAFEKGEVHLLRGGDIDNVDARRIRALVDVATTNQGWEMFSPLAYILMNQRKAPFNDIKVRQAVMHAINRKFIVDHIFFGLGKVATGPIASTTLFYDANVPSYRYDLKKARDLIRDSGVDLKRTTIRLLPLPYGSTWDRLAEYMKQSLERIGFKVEMEAADAGSWSKRVGEFDYDMSFCFSYQYGDPALGVSRHFLSTNQMPGSPFVNNQGYQNPEIDHLLAQAAMQIDPIVRQKLYSTAQQILVAEVANGYLFELENPTFYRKSIKKLVTTAIGLNETFESVYFQ